MTEAGPPPPSVPDLPPAVGPSSGPEGAGAAAPAELLYRGRAFPVPPAGLLLGRGAGSDLRLQTPGAGDEHARIEVRGTDFVIVDLGTATGTFVDGQPLRGGSRTLRSADRITIGDDVLRFAAGHDHHASGETTGAGAELVALDTPRLTIGRHPDNDVVVDDPSVSLFHAEIVVTPEGARARDLGSHNGTRIDGRYADEAQLERGSELAVGHARLVFNDTHLLRRDERGALHLHCSGLTLESGGRTILDRASLDVAPGEFVAVLGRSGAGKSTLIKALAGVTPVAADHVLINGHEVSTRLTDIGYVPQDDIVHELLSLREALTYAARLRLPDDSSAEEIAAAVERVLAELTLEHRAEERIAKLSGGERKRASIAVELLNGPSLVFLDEPAAALDPGLETRVMELLRDLAQPGRRAVVVVTHATKNVNLVDKVCVMGEGGEVCFVGPPAAALEFFGVESFDRIYDALERRAPLEWRRDFERASPPGARAEAERGAAAALPAAPVPAPARRSAWRQARILSARYAKLLVRDRRNLAILIAQVPTIGVAISLLFKAQVLRNPPHGHPSQGAIFLYLLVVNTMLFGTIEACRELIKEKPLSMRETSVGVKLGAYVFSKAFVLFVIIAIQALGLAAIALASQPLYAGLSAYLSVLSILALTGFASIAAGLLASAAANTDEQATSFITLIIVPQLLFAGAIVSVKQMWSPIAALSNVFFTRWAFSGVGSAVDMNRRIAADPVFSALAQFGHSFFSVSLATTCAVLAGFVLANLAGVRFLLGRRGA